jgi:hypothetical protein
VTRWLPGTRSSSRTRTGRRCSCRPAGPCDRLEAIPGQTVRADEVCVHARPLTSDGIVRVQAGGDPGQQTVAKLPATSAGVTVTVDADRSTGCGPRGRRSVVRALTSPVYLGH